MIRPILLCFLYYYPFLVEASGACETPAAMIPCGDYQAASVITDKCQARECLKLESDASSPTPIPIILESTCADPVPVYIFICTVHGNDLHWYIDNERVAAFVPSDEVYAIRSITYPRNLNPIYNVTATLTHVSKMLNESDIPICVSILTVQPLNESDSETDYVPFNIYCQSHCQGEGNDMRTPICQTKRYKVAATPSMPREVTGNITSAAETDIQALGIIVSINWLPPENDNEVTIDYYELTLSGRNTTSPPFRVDTSASLPYYLNVPYDNYTVSVTAVDVCGQRSEPSPPQSLFNVLSEISPTCPSTQCSIDIERQEQLENKNDVLVNVLIIVSILCGVLLLIIVIVPIIMCRYNTADRSQDAADQNLAHPDANEPKPTKPAELDADVPKPGDLNAVDQNLADPDAIEPKPADPDAAAVL